MSNRTLSKRESDLILALEWEKKQIISLREISQRLRCSSVYARKLAHVLSKKGWLERLLRGHYLLIGANRGSKGIPEMNPYFIARLLRIPYFFAYRIACIHYGLLTQIPSVIHISATRLKRPLEIKNVRFEFITLSKKRFFGFEETTLFGEKVKISDLERTVLDALDRPDLVGGIEASAQVLFEARKGLNSSKLLDYLKKMNNTALSRRFAYLSAMFKVKLSKALQNYLKSQVARNPAFLGEPSRWGIKGSHNKDWNLVINVPQQELIGEIQIV
ncbi:MAG: hypothetical protein HYU97_01360 [Deltaproteobacteria bacterium]|nr:hypothetical protein [Deltaproteobacteria bacterium]